MGNITVIILGILLSTLPSGGPDAARKAQSRIKKELGVEIVNVVVSGYRGNADSARWNEVEVSLTNWESDAGTLAGIKWTIKNLEARKKSGEWKLRKLGAAGLEISLDEDGTWDAVSGRGSAIQLTGLWIEDKIVRIKGTAQFIRGYPIELEVTGEPELKDGGTIELGSAGEARILRFRIDPAREIILHAINPLFDVNDFDVISPYSDSHRRRVGLEFEFEVVEVKIDDGLLKIAGTLAAK